MSYFLYSILFINVFDRIMNSSLIVLYVVYFFAYFLERV